MRIVVIGGSGNSGSAIVRALARRGADVHPASRSGKAIAGASGLKADIVSGEGLDAALEGAEVIVDACNSRNPIDPKPFTIGARNVVAAAERTGVQRAVVLSILGVEQSKLSYHRRKREQELTYLDSSLEVSIVRAAQFHEWSVDQFEAGSALGAIPVVLGGRMQPVAVSEVADLCADEALEPSGKRFVEIAGPQVRLSRDLAKAWQAATGARGLIVNGPFPPSMLDYLRSGANFTEQHKGRITFEGWLSRRR
ncbi:NAD(P)H-binding protein [Agrococcus sp. ARC_14]|uniref:SDR family oxidoreductase n=1 Tax=Agrococcus sp. ARC_14 TaxID=2919927 RepID=UPI001F051EDF|nr:NAD(P)H-binding protein [Agrococcus sp. ARC_14]MCH1882061.1 NAD(P)H-binding protein [Agrococcus sp. ARC_14]